MPLNNKQTNKSNERGIDKDKERKKVSWRKWLLREKEKKLSNKKKGWIQYKKTDKLLKKEKKKVEETNR